MAQAGDPVVEQPPTGRQQAGKALGIDVDPLGADVLDHADACDRVEALTGELAVVHDPDLDPIADPRLGDSAPGNPRLGLREGDADHLDTVAGGGMSGEAAPAAADVEHALAGSQPELGADELELVLLGRLQRIGAAAEDRAAVGHRPIEEEGEELGRQVVVVADRPGVACPRPASAARPKLRLRRRGGRGQAAGRERGEQQSQASAASERWRLPAVEQPDHAVEVVDLEVSCDVGPADAELPGSAQGVSDRPR